MSNADCPADALVITVDEILLGIMMVCLAPTSMSQKKPSLKQQSSVPVWLSSLLADRFHAHGTNDATGLIYWWNNVTGDCVTRKCAEAGFSG